MKILKIAYNSPNPNQKIYYKGNHGFSLGTYAGLMSRIYNVGNVLLEDGSIDTFDTWYPAELKMFKFFRDYDGSGVTVIHYDLERAFNVLKNDSYMKRFYDFNITDENYPEDFHYKENRLEAGDLFID